MGCAGSKDGKDKNGTRLAKKGLMGAAKLAAKAGTNEIGDMGDLGDGGELLEGAAKVAAKTAVKAAAKQLQDKDDKKSDHDKETTSKKGNMNVAAKLAGNAASIATDAAFDN